jgi:hypothetical protein
MVGTARAVGVSLLWLCGFSLGLGAGRLRKGQSAGFRVRLQREDLFRATAPPPLAFHFVGFFIREVAGLLYGSLGWRVTALPVGCR